MELYEEVVLDLKGNAIEGAQVRVLKLDGSDAAVFNAAGAQVSNPVMTGALGEFSFQCANGKYRLRILVGGVVYRTVGPITLYDPADAPASVIDAAGYINIPGASDALDKAGVQAAMNAAAAAGGGVVVVRSPIRTLWDLSDLAIPATVIVDDQRYAPTGQRALYGSGDDTELLVVGKSASTGEGPSFVAVNTATAGDRTTSIVARYGKGIGQAVTAFLHFGWLNGSTWIKAVDLITEFSDGFRSSIRFLGGATIINPGGAGKGIDPVTAVAEGYSLVVNKRADAGGGYQLGVKDGALETPLEIHIMAANGAVRFQNAAGANRFSIIADFPASGQIAVYDHILDTDILTLTSGGAIFARNGIKFVSQTAASAGADTIFKDSADGKLKFKDGSSTINPLY